MQAIIGTPCPNEVRGDTLAWAAAQDTSAAQLPNSRLSVEAEARARALFVSWPSVLGIGMLSVNYCELSLRKNDVELISHEHRLARV